MVKNRNIYAAFIRGINVGGNNIISMQDLKSIFENGKAEDVQTYGNSGNVIFLFDKQKRENVEVYFEKELSKYFFNKISILIRDLSDVEKIVNAIPKDWNKSKEIKHDVILLKSNIDSKKIISEINPTDLEELIYYPGVLFWTVKIKDFSKSRLGKIVGTNLYKGMTIRTSNVIKKIYDLMNKKSNAYDTLEHLSGIAPI